jgi:hypothetical protein
MTCHEFLDAMEELALGTAAPAQAESLRAHAASCPSCASQLADAEGLNARLQALRRSYRAPEGLRERVREALSAPAPVEIPARIRLWRWAPAAAAALLIAAVGALFVAGPVPAVPAVVADTLTAYDGLAARVSPSDRVLSSSPETVHAFFRDRLLRDVPTPCVHSGCTCPPGACPCTLVGGCLCDVPSAGGRVPSVLYDHRGTTLALIVVDPSRLGPGVLAASRRVEDRGHTIHTFESGGLSAAVCPGCNPGHLWVSRLPRRELVDAFHAAQADRHPDGGR